jgi:hypothetical protein
MSNALSLKREHEVECQPSSCSIGSDDNDLLFMASCGSKLLKLSWVFQVTSHGIFHLQYSAESLYPTRICPLHYLTQPKPNVTTFQAIHVPAAYADHEAQRDTCRDQEKCGRDSIKPIRKSGPQKNEYLLHISEEFAELLSVC